MFIYPVKKQEQTVERGRNWRIGDQWRPGKVRVGRSQCLGEGVAQLLAPVGEISIDRLYITSMNEMTHGGAVDSFRLIHVF